MTKQQQEAPYTGKEGLARRFAEQVARDEAARRLDRERQANGFFDRLEQEADAKRRDALLRWKASLGREPTTGETLRAIVYCESNEHAQRRARDEYLERIGPTLTLTETLLELDDFGRMCMQRWLLGGAALYNSIASETPSEPACAPHRAEVKLRILATSCPDCCPTVDADSHVLGCGGELGGRPHALRLKNGQVSGDASYLANLTRRGGDTTLYRTIVPDADGCAVVPVLEGVTFLRQHSAAGIPAKRRWRNKEARKGDRWLLEEVPPTPKVPS